MAKRTLRYAVIGVRSEEAFWAETHAAAKRIDAGGGYQGEHFMFSTLSQLFAVFTPNRWDVIGKLQEIGPSTLRGLARALGRDVKRVHEDVGVLLEEGIVERTDDNKLVVPYSSIRIDAELRRTVATAAA